MQRISTETDGVFKNGVPGVQRGTKFNAEWCNAVQEEIAQFIEMAGLTLNGSDPHQLHDALLAIFMAGIQVGGSGISISGEGAAATITNSSIRFQGDGVDVKLAANGLTLNGVLVKEITVSGVATLNISETVELVKNLIVDGNSILRGDARVDGDLTVNGNLTLEHELNANLRGRVTGNTDGTHYGDVHTNHLMAQTSGGPIAVDSETIHSKQPHFQKGFVSSLIELPSGGYSSILVDDVRYTGLPDGSHVTAINSTNVISGIAVSASSFIAVNVGAGVELAKRGTSWYPTCPNVELRSR
jgi:hypothetical protein